MAECSRHPGNSLPGCWYCRNSVEPRRFPVSAVGAVRDFLAAHAGLPRVAVAHYVTATMSRPGTLTSVGTCCDDADEALGLLGMAIAALGGGNPAAPESRSVIVLRDDLRAALSGELPEEARARLVEALGEVRDGS